MGLSARRNMFPALRSVQVNIETPLSFLKFQNTMMAESLFRVFDEDKSGTLSFEEYLQVDASDWSTCL